MSLYGSITIAFACIVIILVGLTLLTQTKKYGLISQVGMVAGLITIILSVLIGQHLHIFEKQMAPALRPGVRGSETALTTKDKNWQSCLSCQIKSDACRIHMNQNARHSPSQVDNINNHNNKCMDRLEKCNLQYCDTKNQHGIGGSIAPGIEGALHEQLYKKGVFDN